MPVCHRLSGYTVRSRKPYFRHSCSNRNCNRDAYSGTDSRAHSRGNCNPNGDAHRNADANIDSNAGSDAHCNTNANIDSNADQGTGDDTNQGAHKGSYKETDGKAHTHTNLGNSPFGSGTHSDSGYH